MHPGFVLGGVELARSKEELLVGSSGMVLAMALGDKSGPRVTPSTTAWLEDVAEVHVRATDATRVPNGQSLIVASEGTDGRLGAMRGRSSRKYTRGRWRRGC